MKFIKGGQKATEKASPPVWVAWIEIDWTGQRAEERESPPVWVAWIEIPLAAMAAISFTVATRMGGVD